MSKRLKFLTKSKIKTNKVCSKQFYLAEYNPELKEQHSASVQKTIDDGRLVEALARMQFVESTPDFVKIYEQYPDKKSEIRNLIKSLERDLVKIKESLNDEKLSQLVFEALSQVVEMTEKENRAKIKKTNEYLNQNKKVIYEATVKGQVLVMSDILYNNGDGTFDVVEIKSGSNLTEDYILDTTIQYYAMVKQSRLRINKLYLWYINSKAEDMENKSDFFHKVDMTETVKKNKHLFLNELKKAQVTQKLSSPPEVLLDSRCSDCPFFNTVCGKESVDNPKSVLNMPSLKSKYNLFNTGIKEVDNPEFKKTDFAKKYPHIIEAVSANKRYVNVEGIKKALDSWIYPLRFFDFEAYMSVFPLLRKTRPYQQTVVQFSMHQLDSVDSQLSHQEWLNNSLDNPQKETVSQIIKALGDSGSIVSYNKTYEITRIKELILKFPEFTEQLESIISRFVDLMEVVKKNIYDPKFMGSYSLKITSPALLGYEQGGYTDSLIKGGHEFSDYYQEYLVTSDLVRKQELEQAMLKYCGYDTLNLYLIFKFLLDLVKNGEKDANK